MGYRKVLQDLGSAVRPFTTDVVDLDDGLGSCVVYYGSIALVGVLFYYMAFKAPKILHEDKARLVSKFVEMQDGKPGSTAEERLSFAYVGGIENPELSIKDFYGKDELTAEDYSQLPGRVLRKAIKAYRSNEWNYAQPDTVMNR